MPATTAELIELLHVVPADDDLFIGPHLSTHLQRTFGGQVLAQALMAAYATVRDEQVAHHLGAYFLRPGVADQDIEYVVDRVRDGRTFASRLVIAMQDGRVIFWMSASFHVPEDGLEHSDPLPQPAPLPEECPSLRDVMVERFGASELWNEWNALDVRFAGDSGASHQITPRVHSSHLRVWVRTTDAMPDDLRLHQAVMAYLSDITLLSASVVPHAVNFTSPRLMVRSIDHTMWFHRPFRADQWILYDQISPTASSSLGYSTGRLFQNGIMVGSASQEGLIRVLPETTEISGSDGFSK
ncbi:acyl-CoA thioesterase domain-containing protein [Brooklawnia cerclae]|uniref:Acyl-CoA thioesterase-2 n=1 Tax=Brooklawnia cerclae TaxID=349934 RepID=A0ABX0SF32_9ACTN|nr:acyl-CoA thioesterase-2 [Brooklawnia cerclae]